MSFPTDFKTVQDAVIGKLRLQDTTANRALVKDWINQAYAQACMETQALQQAGYGTLTSGSSTYALPDTIIELKWVIAKATTDSSFGPPLERVTLDDILGWRMSAGSVPVSSGTVTAYALIGLNQLELWPTPQAADTIQFYYSYLPTALSGDTDVPALQEPYVKVLEYGALVQGGELQMDPLLPTWKAEYVDLKARLRVHLNRRGGVVDQFPVLAGFPLPRNNSTDMGG